ncbi:hypothetical protein SARC_02937 [Sphaeroforma arctica JP610]|uniref:Uncharacterized protein n=1 Tax=Sphaeroforma arctica JP610 TaxID=667725 RepID=A0A0L0G768_9EUKA|nr:hypothetical protein SARC_02937 [Sphaeroforma arctica JP610]KNC84855.1 hypothetical protein SARC_02937 [Sphaeroforma arctica JP610]|eukprot:XP_014158757.1 hypothetical protein SARC_02937 [Sphaeroforma arctica JP610]
MSDADTFIWVCIFGFQNGDAPLHVNCYKNYANAGILKPLLGNGANIEAQNLDNETTLHIACKEGVGYAVQTLVENRTETEAKTVDGKTPMELCASDKVKARLRRAIEERRYLLTVSRFADCIRVARMDSIALATPEFKLAIPAGVEQSLAYVLADAHACYKNILKVRQIREPVIELVMECCAVLGDVQIGAEAGGERDYLKRAEAALATFDTLQSQICSEKETVSDVISERNCMRQRCLALIENALQNRSNDPRPEIGVRAAEAHGKLRTRPSVPNSESQYVRDDRGFRRLCKDVCITGERFVVRIQVLRF